MQVQVQVLYLLAREGVHTDANALLARGRGCVLCNFEDAFVVHLVWFADAAVRVFHGPDHTGQCRRRDLQGGRTAHHHARTHTALLGG